MKSTAPVVRVIKSNRSYRSPALEVFLDSVIDAQKKYGRSAIDRKALIANGYSQTLPHSAKAVSKTDPNKRAGSC